MDSYFENSAWKSARLGKITASEIHRLLKGGRKKEILFGDGAMTYINEKIAEILTGESKDDISGLKALEFGAAHENDAVLTYEAVSGIAVEYFGVAAPKFFPFNAFSGGSPDGLTDTHVIECKCPYASSNHVDFLLAARREESNAWLAQTWPAYFAQVQFNMMCCNRTEGKLISYDPRVLDHEHRLAVINIKQDIEFQFELEYRLTEAAKIIAEAIHQLSPLTQSI